MTRGTTALLLLATHSSNCILNSRLVAYLEKDDLRDNSQTGFCPRLSTVHPLSVVQHLFDMVGDHSPLVFALLDFSKAYTISKCDPACGSPSFLQLGLPTLRSVLS